MSATTFRSLPGQTGGDAISHGTATVPQAAALNPFPHLCSGVAPHFPNPWPELRWIARPDGYCEWFNQQWYDFTGNAPAENLGSAWQSRLHPDDQHIVQMGWQSAINSGKAFDIEFRLRRAADGEFRWHLARATPARNDAGDIERWCVISIDIHDITQRKQGQEMLLRYTEELENRVNERTLELRETNARLQASNRELQDFASVASHDLQEPLRKIQAFGDRLAARSAAALGPEGADHLQRMKNAAGRMQMLIGDLLAYSRVTIKAQPFSPVNLAGIAREVMADLESAVEKNGGEVELGNLPTIDADPMQMRQLLQNLIGNALKFRKPDVKSVVCIGAQTIVEPADEGPASEMCQLMVSDNGIGFDEKYLDRIFNVFQRLHGRTEYEGTGIGLAVCRKIAERHGGSITARSEPGAGSTFIVNLPVHHAAAEPTTDVTIG